MEDLISRFPHIAESIFQQLSVKNLRKCREVNLSWRSFIDGQKFPWLRIIKKRIKNPEQCQILRFFSVSTVYELAAAVDQFFKKGKISKREKPTLIYFAAMCGKVDVVKSLITDVNNKLNVSFTTPLHSAAEKGHFETCQLIIENAKEKCPKDDYDDTPLHFAARHGHLPVFKLLMEYCKHKNPGNLDGNTPLHMAALNGHLNICEAILENIDEKNPRNHFGGTPFHSAAARGHTVICELFIEKKMPTDSSGETPLHLAANNGHLETCQMIMEKVNDKNPKSNDGRTPFHSAACIGHIDVCSLLIQNIEDKNPAAENGWTPLHCAADNDHFDVCKLIMDNVKDKKPKNNNGKTPFQLAIRHGHHSICEALSPQFSNFLQCEICSEKPKNYKNYIRHKKIHKDTNISSKLDKVDDCDENMLNENVNTANHSEETVLEKHEESIDHQRSGKRSKKVCSESQSNKRRKTEMTLPDF